MKRIIRVFPARTHATPDDDLVRINAIPSLFDEADEVHISVAFTWHLKWAEWAAKQWACVAPVKVGGPALNEPGGDFIPGMYLKKGYVITSRGCPNRCWFCAVPKREGGQLRELPVTDGWIVSDDNLLAFSPRHLDEVFSIFSLYTFNLAAERESVDLGGGVSITKKKTHTPKCAWNRESAAHRFHQRLHDAHALAGANRAADGAGALSGKCFKYIVLKRFTLAGSVVRHG